MKIYNIKDMTNGWFVGNFEPTTFKTREFEVGYLTHHKGQFHAPHFHKEAIEINYLIRGQIRFKDKIVNAGDVFIFEQNEVAVPEFLEDCELIVIKTPSVPGDKYVI